MSHTQEVFWGSAWYFIGAILAAGVAYLTKLVLVHTLTVEEYGLFFAVFTFVLFFAVFKSLGLSQGLVRFISQYASKKQHGKIHAVILGSTVLQLITSLVVVGALWLSADWLATTYFVSEQAAWLLRILSLYLPLSILFSNTRAILNGMKLNNWLAAAEPMKNTLTLSITAIAIVLGAQLWAPAWGYMLAPPIFFATMIFVLIKHTRFWKVQPKQLVSENKKLLMFSIPLTLTAVGATLISYFDTLMLTYFDTVVEVGVYNIVYPSAMLLGLIGTAIGAVMLPVVTELYQQHKDREITKAHTIIYVFVFALAFPAVYAGGILSEKLINLFFGAEYVIGATALSILLLGAIAKIITTINAQTLVGLGQNTHVMRVYLYGGGANIVLNLIFIPLYSLTGAAIASALSFLLMMTLSRRYATIPLRFPHKKMLILAVCAISVPAGIQTGIAVIGGIIGATIGLGVGIGIYLMLILRLGIITIHEVKQLIR